MLRKEVEKIFNENKNSFLVLEDHLQEKNPIAILLGGQPASGKSKLLEKVNKKYPGKQFLFVNGDDYRNMHPNANELIKKPFEYSKETQIFSNVFTELLIKEALKNRINIIVEGTMRRSEITSRTAIEFKKENFKVDVFVIACHSLFTELGLYNRYLDEVITQGNGRLAEIKSHNDAYNGLLNTVDDLYKKKIVDNITIFTYLGRKEVKSINLINNKWSTYEKPSGFIILERHRQLRDQKQLKNIYLLTKKKTEKAPSWLKNKISDKLNNIFTKINTKLKINQRKR